MLQALQAWLWGRIPKRQAWGALLWLRLPMRQATMAWLLGQEANASGDSWRGFWSGVRCVRRIQPCFGSEFLCIRPQAVWLWVRVPIASGEASLSLGQGPSKACRPGHESGLGFGFSWRQASSVLLWGRVPTRQVLQALFLVRVPMRQANSAFLWVKIPMHQAV